MNAKSPYDLTQIRPSAELHHPSMHSKGQKRPTTNRRTRAQRRPDDRDPRRGWSLWAKIATGLAVFVGLIAAGVATLLYTVSPTDLVRSELIRQVKENTGRDLSIRGPTKFTFYPSIGVSLGTVALSGPPGMKTAPTLTAGRVDVSVALMPLLKREVRIEHVGLVRPVIELHIDRQGRQSWQVGSGRARRIRLAQLGAGLGPMSDAPPSRGGHVVPAALPAAAVPGFLDKLELRSVALSKAVINYRDDRSGARQQIKDLDLQLNGRRLSDPIKAYGSLSWQNEPVKFEARVDTVSRLLAGQAAKALITVSGQPLSAGFDGSIELTDAFKIAGQTRISGDSLAATTRWLGMTFPNADPLGGFRVSGRLVGQPTSVALNGASMNLGKTKATGTVLVKLRTARPFLSADLQLSEIDIDQLSAGFADGKVRVVSGVRPAGGPDTRRGVTRAPPQSIEDLLRRSEIPKDENGAGRFAPQVRGYTNRNEWSADPIDGSALGLLDAKARLRVNGLKVGGLSIGRTSLRVGLANTVARVDIDDIQLYGGSGKGVITARPRGRGLGIGANLRVDKVAAKALLKDAADFERLDGRGDLTVVVSSAGGSQKALAEGLKGTARFIFKDGAIVGWNVAKIIRGLQKGQFSNFDAVSSEKTDFSELSASFQISNGTAVTNDLSMTSPLLRLSGAGNVGIGTRDLDMSLRPKLVSSIQGQGADRSGTRLGGTGLEIPVKLKGPWNNPRVAPDIGGISKDPSQILNHAKNLQGQFKGKNVGEIVRGALGRNKSTTGGDAPNKDPKQILKQFWK